MSLPGSVGPEKSVPAKKPISPARRIVSLILLAGVIGFGCVEVIPKWGYNAAIAKLEARTAEENKDLMTMQEAEALMGKEADGQAVDFKQNNYDFSKKTYTWNGLLWHYTVTAFYTKEKTPHLHHYASEGKENDIEAPKVQNAAPPAPNSKGASGKGGSPTKGNRGKQGGTGNGSTPSSKAATDTKSPPGAPSDKPTETKPEPSDKAATPKPNPPGDGAPKEKPASPAADGSPSKAADAPATKPLQ